MKRSFVSLYFAGDTPEEANFGLAWDTEEDAVAYASAFGLDNVYEYEFELTADMLTKIEWD